MSRATKPFYSSVELDVEAMSVNVSIMDRATKEAVASELFPAADIHDSCKQKVALYGYSKLLQDRASDVDVGPGKIDAMRLVAAQLAAGQWAKERKIGAIVVSTDVEALARLKSISVPAAQAALKSYPKEVRQQILANEAIQTLSAEIAAEREAQEVTSLDDFVPTPAAETAADPAPATA
jgi:hypothetical protein